MGFQTVINQYQAPATNGDIASTNVVTSAISPEAGFIAGTDGLIVARFAWIDPLDLTGRELINNSSGEVDIQPIGFIARSMQATETEFLAQFGNTIPQGYMANAYAKGDYYVNVTVDAAVRGMKAFANIADGTMRPGNAGAIIAGYIETDYTISLDSAVNELTIMSL
jgi:hypothetical protein